MKKIDKYESDFDKSSNDPSIKAKNKVQLLQLVIFFLVIIIITLIGIVFHLNKGNYSTCYDARLGAQPCDE